MDTLWLSSPAPALRLWADGRWKLNPAAAEWGAAEGLTDARWASAAASLVATLRHPLPSGHGRMALAEGGTEVGWTSVWLDSGWLLWLTVPSADSARLALIEQFGRTGAWERDLRTGEGRWDVHMFRLCGFDPAGGVPRFDRASERVHPDDRERFRREHAHYSRTPGRHETWFRLVLPSGEIKDFHSLCEVHPGPGGRPVRMTGILIDDTEGTSRLREIEAAQIAEREKAQAFARRMDMVTHAAGVGIWTVDVESGIGEWNEQMYRIYGLDPAAGVPGEARWLQELVHPEDRAAMQTHDEVMERQAPHGLQSEFRIRRADGALRWVSAWSRRERIGGRLMAFGVNIDITELRSTREQLRQAQERTTLAAESAGIGTWERDLRTQVSQWDAQMFRLRGRSPDGPLGVAELRDGSRHPDDVAEIERRMAAAARDGGIFEHEFRVVWPDGSLRWLATRGHVQRDAQGRPERVLGVNWDITERKRAEQALREKAAAEQASRAKSEFLARMSHELRTPLNAVLGFAQLLALDSGDPLSRGQAERVGRIRSAGQHLLALIDDVLDLASIESRSLPLAQESVSLQAVLQDVLEWTRLQADEAQVQVHTDAAPAHVQGDPRRVRQVLANLLSNAIKYNRAGGQVWIGIERGTLEGAPAWTVSVRDSGRGMSTAQRRHLFEPFNRLGAEREAIQGTGIGLAIVHHLVKAMHGEIGVDSEPGRGSEFRVRLPAASPQAVAAAIEQAHADTVPAALADAPLRLLYIEDNPVNVLLVQELLARHGRVELSVAVDGLSGVSLAQRSRPDVVLVDMQLPDIDGAEVLRRLRADAGMAGSTLVALSANAMPEDVSRAREIGFDDYWTKPIDFKAFLGALDRLAHQRALR